MADSALDRIEHIVVLMLENRSFDHMLGYLSLASPDLDVDGVDPAKHFNEYNGVRHRPARLSTTRFSPDPGHDWEDVEEQLSDDNGGFVRNFAHEDGQEPQRIMGYHDAEQVPSFDHLARRFTVCDRWFASVPGPTQPNRQYAICGTSEGRRNNQKGVPTWRAKTIFDHLSERRIGWRYYSHDVAFLRAHVDFRAETNQIKKVKEFYATVRTGKLPRVSWIDPDFGLPILNATRANDDHPDHDVREGQRLVGRIYNALLDAPDKLLDKTLLIVTYDEHGGFYDHVAPPTADDDDPHFRRLGVRVPTLLVSNRVARTTSHEQYDHTSIVKTIMERFLRQPDGSLPDMGKRVASARSLAGEILDEPRAPQTRAPTLFESPEALRTLASEAPGPMNDLQITLDQLRQDARARGLDDDEL